VAQTSKARGALWRVGAGISCDQSQDHFWVLARDAAEATAVVEAHLKAEEYENYVVLEVEQRATDVLIAPRAKRK